MAAAEQVVVLENGCMCCSVRGDILGAFAQILERIDQAMRIPQQLKLPFPLTLTLTLTLQPHLLPHHQPKP